MGFLDTNTNQTRTREPPSGAGGQFYVGLDNLGGAILMHFYFWSKAVIVYCFRKINTGAIPRGVAFCFNRSFLRIKIRPY